MGIKDLIKSSRVIRLVLYISVSFIIAILSIWFLLRDLSKNVEPMLYISKFLFGITLSTSVLGYIYSFIIKDQTAKRYECDISLFDLWTIPHLIGHIFLTTFFYNFIRDPFIVFLLIALEIVLWELLEIWITNLSYNFACENRKNKISDIITGFIGYFIGTLLFLFFH